MYNTFIAHINITHKYKGVITLIYKHGDRDLLKNWRPITLLNCDYKIVAKCFAERIKPHLSNLIKPDQKGCLQRSLR